MPKGHKNWLEDTPSRQMRHNLNIKMYYNPMNKIRKYEFTLLWMEEKGKTL